MIPDNQYRNGRGTGNQQWKDFVQIHYNQTSFVNTNQS